MYCKKCGTEQRDGQKFCPKCGEPFLDENGKPYLKGIKKDMQDAKEKMTSKVDELAQQGRRFVDEKVQPQLNEKINELKKVDWDEKKNESVKSMQGFFSNPNKLRNATIGIAIITVLWFFIFNHGFSASWTWWIFAVAFIIAAFYKAEAKDKLDELKKARWTFGLAVLCGLVFLFHSPSSNSHFDSFDADVPKVNSDNMEEAETLLEMAKVMKQIKSMGPEIESLYNVHQQFVMQGGNPNFSPAWGKWQDCNKKLDDLWDEYIRLARKHHDHEALIKEAKEHKRTMDQQFLKMFAPQY